MLSESEPDSETCVLNCSERCKHLSFCERYFKFFYAIDLRDGYCEDELLLLHSNDICVITLAPTHPALRAVSTVSFDLSSGNLVNNKVSGKRKRGAKRLKPKDVICEVVCEDKVYLIRNWLDGNLLEVNTTLLSEPHLLKTEPQGRGFIAIVNVSGTSHKQFEKFFSSDKYLLFVTNGRKLNMD